MLFVHVEREDVPPPCAVGSGFSSPNAAALDAAEAGPSDRLYDWPADSDSLDLGDFIGVAPVSAKNGARVNVFGM